MNVLNFCIDAGIRPFYLSMAAVAHSLQALGHTVYTATCEGDFRRCVYKLSTPHPISAAEQASYCKRCTDSLGRLSTGFALNHLPLATYAGDGLDEEIDALIEEWQGDPLDFTYDGERLGRLAQFDLFLAWKILTRDGIGPSAREYFREGLHAVVKTYILAKRIISDKNIDRVLVFNQYGPNMAVYRAAVRCGALPKIMSISSHAGVDRRFIWFSNQGPRHFYFGISRDWAQWSRVPLSPEMATRVSDDIAARFTSGSIHVYSPRKDFSVADIRTHIGLRNDRKTVVVFTSSPDEISAQDAADEGLRLSLPDPSPVFRDQSAWLADIKRLAARRDDLQFCIRIHPREGANQRDDVQSEHLSLLRNVLTDLPDNVRVIWPQDEASSYDLLDGADLVMTAWSTMGLESARLGVPVLSPFQRLAGCPIGDFIKVPSTLEDYYAAIDRMLDAPADLFNIRQAFRWYAVSKFAAAVPVADAFPDKSLEGPFAVKVLDEAETIERIMALEEPEEKRRLAAGLATVPDAAQWHAEERAVVDQLAQALVYSMTGEWPAAPVTVRRGAAGSAPDTAFLHTAEGICTLTVDGKRFQKYSRLVARLGEVVVTRDC